MNPGRTDYKIKTGHKTTSYASELGDLYISISGRYFLGGKNSLVRGAVFSVLVNTAAAGSACGWTSDSICGWVA